MKNQINTSKINVVSCILLFSFLPFGALAQLNWYEPVYYTTNTSINQNIFLGNTNVDVYVSSGVIVIINGVISDGGNGRSITMKSSGTLILNGANTYTGTTYVNSGTLQIGNGGTTGSINSPVTVSSPGKIVFKRSNVYTFSRTISGTGSVTHSGTGTLILTATNHSYTGTTVVSDGILQLGNGGTANGGNINSTSGVSLSSLSATLKFMPGYAFTFSKSISGFGKVEFEGTETKTLTITNSCGYFGSTTIEAGRLYLSENGSLPNSNVTLNSNTALLGISTLSIPKTIGGLNAPTTAPDATVALGSCMLTINTSSACFFAGKIIGTGTTISITKNGSNSLTLAGVNDCGGITVGSGTLILSENGTINNSVVTLLGSAKLDISAGNKTIAGLNAATTASNSEVILGSNTLTINAYTSAFAGKFSGSGGVTVNTNFTMYSIDNTATGTFTHNTGSVVLDGCKWAGDYTKSTGSLTITGNPTISGALTLQGGNINMNLDNTTPSKLNVLGNVTATGTNTLNVTTSSVKENYVLIEAASGITSLAPYALAPISNWPSAGLNVNSPTQLLFSTTTYIPVTNITNVPTTATATLPLTLTGTVVPSNATNQTITWTVQNTGTTGATISGGNILNTTNSGTATVLATIVNGASPTSNFTEQFTITVSKAILGGTVAINGNAVFGETLTANTSGLSSTPTIPSLGTLVYQWKRNNTNISGATNATYNLVEADIGNTITVTVTAVSCTGEVTSNSTATVAKATQIAPAAPTLSSSTFTSITLNTITGCEYNINGGAFQSSPVFSGLTPSTSYAFTQRKAATSTHLASPESPVANFSTPAFIAVTDITGVPTTATATLPFTLTGTVVPSNATNKTITWTVQNAGTTGATISGNNTLNTNNSGTVTILATIVNGASPTANYTKPFTITVSKAALSGTVTITGNAVFGQTLTANTSGLTSTPTIPNLGTLTYQWKRGTTNIGTNSATYTLVQADIGNTITITVTTANCDGSRTSNPTATVTKATQTAPAAPTLASKTETSIRLNSVTGCEYNRDGGNWQTATTFSGLTPNTTYSFRARKTETATHLASPQSSAASFKTDDEVGIDENEQGKILVYPNPTTGKLSIVSEQLSVESVEIFDVYGRKLKGEGRREKGEKELLMDISALATGVYFLRIMTEQGEIVRKVVKE